MEQDDWPAIIAGVLHELPSSFEVVLDHRLGTTSRHIRTATGKYRVASPVILRLSEGPMKIRHLVHHVDQCRPSLLVVERRMEAVRPEPALCTTGIGYECLYIRVLLKL